MRAEFEDVLRFWLDRGVDGFRIDVAHGMVKAARPARLGRARLDDRGSDDVEPTDTVSGAGNQGPMFDQDGVHDIYRAWHRVLAEYDGDRALVAEAWVEPLSRLTRYVRPDEMHQAFNFAFLATHWDAAALRTVVEASYRASDAVGAPDHLGAVQPRRRPARRPASAWPSPARGRTASGTATSSPTRPSACAAPAARRCSCSACPARRTCTRARSSACPTTPSLDDDLRQDPAFFRTGGAERGRDGCRVPAAVVVATRPGFGFSPTGVTWLPQPAAWASYALDAQRGVAGSTYETYRAALRLRRESGLGSGGMEWLHGLGDDVIAFVNRDVLVVANLGSDPVALPAGAEVLLASIDPAVGADGSVAGAVGRHRLGPLHGLTCGTAPLRRGRSCRQRAVRDVPGLGGARRDRDREACRPRPIDAAQSPVDSTSQ